MRPALSVCFRLRVRATGSCDALHRDRTIVARACRAIGSSGQLSQLRVSELQVLSVPGRQSRLPAGPSLIACSWWQERSVVV